MTNVKNNSRLIIVQLLYSHHINQEKLLFDFKNPYKRFIKKICNGVIENNSVFIFEHVKRIPDASQCHNSPHCGLQNWSNIFEKFWRHFWTHFTNTADIPTSPAAIPGLRVERDSLITTLFRYHKKTQANYSDNDSIF